MFEQRGGWELAEELTGLTRNTLRAMVKQKQIPHMKLSTRKVVFDRLELEKWIANNTVTAEDLHDVVSPPY